MKHETFAGVVLVFLVVYAAWYLIGRMEDGRCRVGKGDVGLVCTERPPIVLPSDAPDLDRV